MKNTLLALLSIVASLNAAEFVDIDGAYVSTVAKNNLIIIGTENCDPMKRLATLVSTNIQERYKSEDVQVLLLFPCQNPQNDALKVWRQNVPGAAKLCLCEIPLSSLFLTNWANSGYANPSAFVVNKSGVCTTNIPHYNPDWKTYGAAVSREFLNLRINRDLTVDWNQNTGIRWRLYGWGQGGQQITYILRYP